MTDKNLIRQLGKWSFTSGIAVREALSKGVAFRHPPENYKLHERDATFLADMMTEPHSGLSVGDKVRLDHHDRGLTPWALEPKDQKQYGHKTIYEILCFAEASLEGKCSITGRFAVLRWLSGDYGLGGVSHDEKSGKIYLYWVGLLTTDISD